MKIALAQINPTVGDIVGNLEKIKGFMARAARRGADLVVFPELCLTGYPPRDLVEHADFVKRNRRALQELASVVSHPGVIVGYVEENDDAFGKTLSNAAALLHHGKIVGIQRKRLLPTYDVFDESRNFAPADRSEPVTFQGVKLGITICEDMWNPPDFWPRAPYAKNPVEELAKKGAQIFINISSSPFHHGKTRLRLELIESHVRRIRRPFFFVNQVGGNDELIFDGHSLAVDRKGRLIARGKGFTEDLVIVETRAEGKLEWRPTGDIEEIRDALVLGLRDYVRKCGFHKVVLGLSGGIDSAVTAVLAVEAVGAGNVLGVAMPGPYSSKGSLTDAFKLAKSIKIKLLRIPISSSFSSLKSSLAPAFRGLAADVTEENLQARIRGVLLMALSNKFGALLLSTGNKSELSMGYCTLYGDMNGGLAVISDVPKTRVYELGRLLNLRRRVIPETTFTKPPSAELRPNQTDQDSLPPYEVLDAIVMAYVEDGQDVDGIAARGFPRELVQEILTTIDRNEYKRRQAAPGLRITPKAFGMGRRLPIARGDFRRPEDI
jgi:NAD+ synthase (glutamine-hydrolysing)